MEKWSHR